MGIVLDYKTGKEIKPDASKCSFCGKPEHQVEHMISNNQGKYICNYCVTKFTGFKVNG